jgi:hypothetical protein
MRNPLTDEDGPMSDTDRRGQQLVQAAAEFALGAHAGHLRKALGTPYIGHPLAVAGAVLAHGGSWELAAAALLHDTVEDVGADPADILALFGTRIASLVATVTEPTRSTGWAGRKAAYLEQIARAQDDEVLLLVGCDKLDNLRSLRMEHAILTQQGPAPAKFGFYGAVLALLKDRLPRLDATLQPMVGALIAQLDESYCACSNTLGIDAAAAVAAFREHLSREP